MGEAGEAKLRTWSTGPAIEKGSVMSASSNSKSGRPTRCSTLRREPVRKLSTHTTRSPRASKASQRCEPRKPAPPRTTARLVIRRPLVLSLTALRKAPYREGMRFRWLCGLLALAACAGPKTATSERPSSDELQGVEEHKQGDLTVKTYDINHTGKPD